MASTSGSPCKVLPWHFRSSVSARHLIVRCSSKEDAEELASSGRSSSNELAAKLAAAEAEADVLRRELAARTGKQLDLSKLKPATPDKRIDGTGYRETLLGGVPGKGELPNEWGLTESGLSFEEEDQEEERTSENEEESRIVSRRLLIGGGLAAVAIGLSLFKLPPGTIKPPRPLQYYLFRILQLKRGLEEAEVANLDSEALAQQLESISASANEWKETFLSAAAWLDGANAEKASSLAFSIYEYLQQVDYKIYFDPIREPSASEKLEFLKFSLQSTQAAKVLVDQFLSLAPRDTLEEATLNRPVME